VPARVPFCGAVLAGGRSSRMGRDKALVEVGPGRPLVVVAAQALEAAGASAVIAVGGDQVGLEALGLRWVPDRFPGQGPLAGILTALAEATTDVVVVLACDMPGVGPEVPAALVAALDDDPSARVAAAVVGDRDQPLTAAWRCSTAQHGIEAAFDAGQRAPRRLLEGPGVVRVLGLPIGLLEDVDSPDDLRRYAERHSTPNPKD
jgi:molybdopterin-guanine dinucleotide biosynthesis protein A